MSGKKSFVVLAVLLVVSMLLTACPAPAPEVVEKVVTQVVEQEVKVVETVQVEVEKIVEKTVEVEKVVASEDYSTPHPILSDVRVRQAIAHCIDRDAAIASVYPYVEDKAGLRMDVGVPKSHWAWSGPYQDYEYDPAKGAALLEEAGWTLEEGAEARTNAEGEVLAIKFSTTNAQFRQTWSAVVVQNLAECGIQLLPNYTPGSWWFGDTSGLARRDFELGAYAWVGQPDPSGRTLYACSQIPLPSNGWEGQNYMGWCNEEASQAIVQANNTLEREDRKEFYNTVWEHFAADMVSLPMFQRAEAEAWGLNLEGIVVDPTEYATASAADWTLADGGDTIVVAFSQEPASMFSLVESAAVQAQVAQMAYGVNVTWYNYDYQAAQQDELSTIESGKAVNSAVDVAAGDTVYNITGEVVPLEKGTVLINADGEEIEYDGSSPLQMNQLVVEYGLKPYTWSDGTPGAIADVELAYKINCDRDSGATEYITCDTIEGIEYGEDLSWTITYWPGVQTPDYYAMPFSHNPNAAMYPSHLVLSDGRNLADVPAAEWATLPEIADKPLSWGPFYIDEWIKGQSINLKANPYYEGGTGVENITVVIIEDTNQAVAQLLSGDVDYVEKATLGGGAEVQTVVDAAAQGLVNMEIIPSPTWEHIDFNLFTK